MTSYAFGQNTGPNVVNTVIASGVNLTAGTTTYITANLQNYGQTSHILTANFSNTILANTGISLARFFIQASIDGTNWFLIGANQANLNPPTGLSNYVFSGYGAYPYLRANVQIILDTGSSTTVSINYSGVSAPSSNLIDIRGPLQGILTVGGTYANGAGQIAEAPPFSTTQQVSVYGLQLDIPTTASALTMGCTKADGTTIDTTNKLINLANFTVAKEVILPMSIRPYVVCIPGGSVFLTVAGTGNTGFNINFRSE